MYMIPLVDIGVPATTTLADYLKTYYETTSEMVGITIDPVEAYVEQIKLDYTLINDNQTTIGSNHEAWQLESTSQTRDTNGLGIVVSSSDTAAHEIPLKATRQGGDISQKSAVLLLTLTM
jgi:hypothetical protein